MRRILKLFLVAAVPLLSSSCIGMIVDWAPVEVVMAVLDSEGNDLLDPANPDNLIDGTTITFKGDTYYASREYYEKYQLEPETKAYMPHFSGLQLRMVKNVQTGAEGYCLVFGEIDGAADMDEDLVVTLANGVEHTIHYHCSRHREFPSPSCKRTWKLDGEKVDSGSFAFIVE